MAAKKKGKRLPPSNRKPYRLTNKKANTPKRSLGERELDLVEIARLYMEGLSQSQIAAEVSKTRPYTLSRQQVGYDLAEIKETWKQRRDQSMEAWKDEEMARLDDLEQKYRRAWDRSLERKTRTVQEQRLDE